LPSRFSASPPASPLPPSSRRSRSTAHAARQSRSTLRIRARSRPACGTSARRAQLEAQWGRFAESNRNVCVQQTYVGGYPSYDDVLTCLQMYGPSSAGASTRRKRNFGQ
jgi:hypothetical protein